VAGQPRQRQMKGSVFVPFCHQRGHCADFEVNGAAMRLVAHSSAVMHKTCMGHDHGFAGLVTLDAG
jgi:hypothetical protein